MIAQYKSRNTNWSVKIALIKARKQIDNCDLRWVTIISKGNTMVWRQAHGKGPIDGPRRERVDL